MVEKTDHILFPFVNKVEFIDGVTSPMMKETWHLEEDHPHCFEHQPTCNDFWNDTYFALVTLTANANYEDDIQFMLVSFMYVDAV